MAGKTLLLAALSSLAIAAPHEPLEGRQACSSLWSQCGGQNWAGATCCASGSVCTYSNPWYSQCLPGTGPPPAASSSTRVTSSSSSRVSSASSTRVTATSSTRVSVSQGGGSSTVTQPPTSASSFPVGSGTATWSGNPFTGVRQFPNSYYASEVSAYAVPTMGAKAAAVAQVPSYMWLDTRSKVPLMASTLADIRAANRAGANPPYVGLFVVYDLPDRDCAAAASNGEYSIANGGVANYKAYIDAIVANLKTFSDVRVNLVIEPDSLANLITNMNVAKCSNAASAYQECTQYAIKSLNLPNVAMYLDAGHGGWLGWPANLGPAAQMYANVWKNAGQPKSVRGLVTNVANYNGWDLASPPSYTTPNPNYDEKKYIHAMSSALTSAGWPNAYFITDTGRSGKQPTGQLQQGDWCNQIGTGFGARPSTNTGDSLTDAFVWVKPGGESDGTSDTSAVRYDFHCGLADALKPAPEAGQWFQKYFEQLFNNANPAF